jgi:hypothetical protein
LFIPSPAPIATMHAIHDGAAALIDGIDAAMTGEPLALSA